MWSGKSQLPCSQRLRLHGLTSSDLGLRTWDLCEPALSSYKWEVLGELMGPLNLAHWIVAKLLCPCPCLFGAIVELHAKDEIGWIDLMWLRTWDTVWTGPKKVEKYNFFLIILKLKSSPPPLSDHNISPPNFVDKWSHAYVVIMWIIPTPHMILTVG